MLLRQSVSSAAQQLLCACITADMRMHNSCCACVAQLLCTNYCPDLWHTPNKKRGCTFLTEAIPILVIST